MERTYCAGLIPGPPADGAVPSGLLAALLASTSGVAAAKHSPVEPLSDY